MEKFKLSDEFIFALDEEIKRFANYYYMTEGTPEDMSEDFVAECYNQFSDEVLTECKIDEELKKLVSIYYPKQTDDGYKLVGAIQEIVYKPKVVYPDTDFTLSYGTLSQNGQTDITFFVSRIDPSLHLGYDTMIDYKLSSKDNPRIRINFPYKYIDILIRNPRDKIWKTSIELSISPDLLKAIL